MEQEHRMKISPLTVRRLRIERGWSQEQLAIASGLSVRTVQRVEADGVASMSTAVSLAATYGVELVALQEEPRTDAGKNVSSRGAGLFLGVAMLTVAVLGESARLPRSAESDVLAAINILAALIGMALMLPAMGRVLRQRRFAGAALAVLGTPLVTLLAGGAIFALLSGQPLHWPLAGMGAAGAALLVMAVRELGRDGTPAGV